MAKKTKVLRATTGTDVHYKTIPALAVYIDRIGAEQLNFRRFMVKEFKGNYYTERCIISIVDNEIHCSKDEYAPTEEEAANIKGALLAAKFPKAMEARDTKALMKEITGEHYEFINRKTGGIIMVQERVIKRDGNKGYIPWCFFDDGAWRKMEPDGALPFWKPAKKTSNKIMIHEGAKSAAFVTALINDPERLREHPWGDTLREYEHWGMIGGALAPHRAKYSEITEEKPTDVVYVCDNDHPGKSALQEVSRYYGGKLKGIMFDPNWPLAWDMADPMPKVFFNKKRYIGPKLEKLLEPATRATLLVSNEHGKGRSVAVLRKEFKEEWIHSVTPEAFLHIDWPNKVYSAAEFNSLVAPYSDVDDTARLIRKDAAGKGTVLKYDPATEPGIFNSPEVGKYVNTFSPSQVTIEEGDPTPFLEFMEKLVPDKNDRHHLLKWCATLVARPDIRMLYGVLLISEVQGVGKGTLGEKILAPLVGELNVSYPNENEIVDSNFNYWLAHKRLAVVHEIYAGHSTKGYNRLKSIITDKFITVSKKYQANYEVQNWIHVFACSNSMRALQLSVDDRRWYLPRVNEEKQPTEYWINLNRWLTMDNGLGIIGWWAKQFVLEHGPVMQGEIAPTSTMKDEVIEESMSPGMRLVAAVLDHIKASKDQRALILDTDLVQLIRDQLYDGKFTEKLERPLTLRKLAKTKGWHINPHRCQIPAWKSSIMGGRLICLSPQDKERLPGDLNKAGRKPTNVAEVWSKMAPL